MSWQDEVEPVYEGVATLWLFQEPEEKGGDPRWNIHIPGSSYLIYAPQAHPNWDWHVMLTVSLEESEGVDPPKFQYVGAECEINVWALWPDDPPPDPRVWPMGKTPAAIHMMHPPDAVVQFHGPTKKQVPEMVSHIARAVSAGMLVPDTDHRDYWKLVIQKTAEHYRGHPEFN